MNDIDKTFGEYLLGLRKERKITRDAVYEKTNFELSRDRLEGIEKDTTVITAKDVVLLAQVYGLPELPNKYCREHCDIGCGFREVTNKDLSHIAVDTLTALHRLNAIQERLLEIFEDGTISPDEYSDFNKIRVALDKIATSADNLKLWIDDAKTKHQIPENFE